MPLSRRAFLVAAGVAGAAGIAGLTAVEARVLPGRARLRDTVGNVDAAAPAATAQPVRYNRFDSAARAIPVTWAVATPVGVEDRGLPVVLILHGRGATARAAFDELGLDRFLSDHVERGGPPVALVSVDGGEAYWHPRASGDDPLRMLTAEVLPRAAALGLRTDAIAVLGWSMGGYGALLLARESSRRRLGGVRVAAAAAGSPALFASPGATSRGSFDDPADFERWGALAAEPGVTDTALHVSCGVDDPFAEQTRRYRDNAQTLPAGGLGPGGHDGGYWRSLAPAQLAFLAEHLPG